MQKPTKKIEFGKDEDVSFSDLLGRFLPYWPFFLLLMFVGIFGAWLYLRYTFPVYRTTATLLVKNDKKTGSLDPLESFDMFGSIKNVQNEVEVLQSKTLMQEVVKNLHLYAPVTEEGRLLKHLAYVSSPIDVEARNPDSIKFSTKIFFKYDAASQAVDIENTDYPLDTWVNTRFGVLKFNRNKYYQPELPTDKNNKFYFSLIDVKNAANGVLGSIKVDPSSKESTVIDLSIIGQIPQRGEDILNELLKVYNQAAISDKNVLAANTLKFVDDRLKYVVNELDSVEGRLQHFKSNNNITDISAQGQIFLQSVSLNDQKLSDVNIQLAVLDQVEGYVKSKGNTDGIVPATLGVGDPILTGLLGKLSDLEVQYTEIKKIVPENNPSAIALMDAINKLRPGILENIRNQRKNLVASKDDLRATTNNYTSMLKTIPGKERELLGISRQQAIKNNIYTFLLQKREETALSFASAVADSRILDKAESSDAPVSPKRLPIFLGAIAASLVLGIALILLKELLTRTIQQKSDIEKNTQVPFLGEVVYDRSKSGIVIAEGKRSFIAEQFRQLRTSLSYLGIDETHRRILVTSSISGEGKSFISTNLGISLALMGKKVILIELDLRKPKLSDQFNISRNSGISNYLIGKMEPEDIIKDTGTDNLFLIPSGPIPPNPSELIANGRLAGLLTYLEKSFDYIIIDTAPINPVTDAYIISPLANVTLFIVRHGYTPKIFLQKLEAQHKMNNPKNAAIIYNGVQGKGFERYGYGYGYGYGYTDEEGEVWWKRIFKNKKN